MGIDQRDRPKKKKWRDFREDARLKRRRRRKRKKDKKKIRIGRLPMTGHGPGGECVVSRTDGEEKKNLLTELLWNGKKKGGGLGFCISAKKN